MSAPARSGRSFLLEVGCEEIPAGMLPEALEALQGRLLEALGGDDGLGGEVEQPPPFGGPRRLVAFITGIRDREEDRIVQVTGPPVAAAFDPQGAPTRAALGFAKAQGIDAALLERVRGEKGEVIAARKKVAGRGACQVLAEACPRILGAMRFPKMMKWGDRGFCFVRPVHWIVALLDEEIVPFEFLGVSSGRATWGHRFLSAGPHDVPRAQEYERVLMERGKVAVRVSARRSRIIQQREQAAVAAGWTALEDEGLLEEIVFLTEYPGVIAGSFPEEFLELPEPVLITSMKHHQKYFAVRRGGSGLAPGFLAVTNMDGDEDGAIRRGNEWVLKARLADAKFFWREDRRRGLSERVADLERIAFQERLGSNLSRVERIESLAALLARDWRLADAPTAHLLQAARLCKADLTTGMVREFPELQGIMGGLYARAEGIPEPVAVAIEQHYRPASTQGACPETQEGCLLALANRIDLLAGGFAAGLTPKGSADPYGIRRAAQGICRILLSPVMAAGGRISMKRSIEASLAAYVSQGAFAAGSSDTAGLVLDFLAQRLRFLMEEKGMRFDTARAVLAAGFDDVRDAWLRGTALTSLRGPEHEADFEALATSAKRIRNILTQAAEKGIRLDGAVADPGQLVEAEEKHLLAAVSRVAEAIAKEVATNDYKAALREIASLRPQVDRFFDKVLVMAPEEALRRNRLALLQSLSGLLSKVADFSEIVVEGETSEKRG